jgi:hypothetical protein
MSTIKLPESAPNQFQKVGDFRFAYHKVGTAPISTGEPS